MKYLIIVFFALFVGANDGIYDIVSEYRKDGVRGIKSKLEQYLVDKKYWDSVVSAIDTRFGYYESVKFLFIAQKNTANLQLWKLDSNKFAQISQNSAIFGENKNDKKAQGDLATPVGVYNLNAKLSNLDQYYGPLAFSTSYPNLYDKLNKKTGNGIWIHGMPLNGDRSEQNTRGCIAVENNILMNYDKAIDHKATILITSQNGLKEVSKSHISTILHALFVWRDAWINNDLDLYLSFYDDSFLRFDGMTINNFKEFKKRVFAKEETKTIEFRDINIAPYPNADNLDMFRVTFLEDYKADSGYTFKGTKELYVIVKNNAMRIIVEK